MKRNLSPRTVRSSLLAMAVMAITLTSFSPQSKAQTVPATPAAKPATPDAKPATPDAKPATPDAQPATPDAKPATTGDTKQTIPANPASGPMVQVKLSPEQQKEMANMQVQMARMQFEEMAMKLTMTKQALMEMGSRDSMNGTYMFLKPFTDESVEKAIVDLNTMARRMKQVTRDGTVVAAPITVILNSPGGSVISEIALHDHLEDLKRQGHHLTIKVRGIAASCGSIVLQAGDTRIIGRHSRVLIHEVSSGTFGKVSEQREQLAISEGLWSTLVDILAEKSKVSAEKIRENAKKDWVLTAKEAVELGFADKIE